MIASGYSIFGLLNLKRYKDKERAAVENPKYRQELIANGWKIKEAVFEALRETGISMFYTSVVLFFGFSVFLISNFGGTQALGGLVAVTLFMAMLANLILLPSLLISLEDSISNSKDFKQPRIMIIDQ